MFTIFIILIISTLYAFIFIRNVPLAVFILFFVYLAESVLQVFLNIPIVELQSPFYFSLGNFHIYAGDVFFISFLLAFSILFINRLKLNVGIPIELKWLTIYGFVIAYNVIAGWITYQTDSIVHSRGILYSLCLIFAFGIRKTTIEEIEKIFKSVFVISILYLFILYFREFGILDTPINYMSFGLSSWLTQRLLNRWEAVFLIFGLIYVILSILREKEKINILNSLLFFLFLFAILRTGIRSIWIVTIFSIMFVLFIRRAYTPTQIGKYFIIIIIVILSFNELIHALDLYEYIYQAVTSVSYYDETTTFHWRNIMSMSYIYHMSLENYLFGTNFGVIPTIIDTNVLATGLHNNYVEVLFYGGIISLIIFYMVYIKLLIKLTHIKSTHETSSNTINLCTTILFSYLIFNFSWTIDILNSLLMGLAIAFLNELVIRTPSDGISKK